jgi:hypothetical protein
MNSSARVLTTLIILLVLGGAAHAQYNGPQYNGTVDPLSPPPPGSSSVYGKTYNPAEPPLAPQPNSGANPAGYGGNSPISPESTSPYYNPNHYYNPNTPYNPNSPHNQNSPYNENSPYNPYDPRR